MHYEKNKNYTLINKSLCHCQENDETITMNGIIENYNIVPSEVSLILVNIGAQEEFVLNDLYTLHTTYKIPLFIYFHYNYWKDKNLEWFDFLTPTQKESIQANPSTAILFDLALF